MQRLIERMDGRVDGGATAVTVAILLMVLLSFTGLGVDVTSAYAKQQEVQNAADAAALAVAQHCAEDDVTCSEGSQAGAATDLAKDNVRLQAETVAAHDSYPESNWVTVEVTAEHQNFFAGLFGFNSFTVVREATAVWEAPVGGPSMLPLTISACNFFDAVGEPVLNQEIAVWLPKGKLLDDFAKDDLPPDDCGTLGYPPGGFGWLDHTNCETDINVGDWTGGDNGADRPTCLKDLLKVGGTFLLPIFTDIRGTGANADYQIVRFAAMELLGYHFKEGAQDLENPVYCPDDTFPGNADYRDSCLYVKFVEWVELEEDYDGEDDDDSEVSVIRLIDPEYEASL